MRNDFTEAEKTEVLKVFRDALGVSYVDALLHWAEKRAESRFLNDSTQHARLVALLMIGQAEKSVDIYTEGLIENCYDLAFEKLSPNVKVRVLARRPDQTRWVRAKNPASDICVETAPSSSLLTNHFFVVDGCAFREEIDHDLKTARASFNDPEKAKELGARFIESWEMTPSARFASKQLTPSTRLGVEQSVSGSVS